MSKDAERETDLVLVRLKNGTEKRVLRVFAAIAGLKVVNESPAKKTSESSGSAKKAVTDPPQTEEAPK